MKRQIPSVRSFPDLIAEIGDSIEDVEDLEVRFGAIANYVRGEQLIRPTAAVAMRGELASALVPLVKEMAVILHRYSAQAKQARIAVMDAELLGIEREFSTPHVAHFSNSSSQDAGNTVSDVIHDSPREAA